uniref:Secreted protein n=1 Tax=Macrostomum lignano TaxID=282301 RepID=A0A1I8HQ69_9PLAT
MASLSRLRNFTTLILSATLLYGFFMLTPAAESETGTAASPSSVLKSRVLFVLMCQSQAASFHKQRCDLLRRHIEDQAKELKVPAGAETPDISIALAEDLVDPGIETFFYLPILAGNHTQLTQSDFVFFCHEETRMNLVGLLNQLAQYNSSKLASLISIELHLANLTALSAMCPRSVNLTDSCITWTTEMFRLPQCFPNSSAVSAVLNRTLFAVKTHQANFATVLSVVRDTWAKEAPNIIYYADVEDREIPTVACGVPNTERGHCDKLNRILHLLAESNNVSAQATNNADGSDKSKLVVLLNKG